MENIRSFLSGSFHYLSTVILGEHNERPLIYVLCFSFLVLVIGCYGRGYDVAWLKRQIRSLSATLFIFLFNVVGFAPIAFLFTDRLQAGYGQLGIPHVDPALWAQTPIWILVPLILLVHDFADYWNHRLMHRAWLWPIHAIHHSETEMNGMTTYRVHFLEPVIMKASYILILSWVGLPGEALGWGAIALTLHNAYVHMDIDWGHGPFRYLLASPRFHKWHHADTPEAYGKNLANVFPFYDVLFGTYYMPGICHEPLGVKGMAEHDAVKLSLYPFQQWGEGAKSRFMNARKSLVKR